MKIIHAIYGKIIDALCARSNWFRACHLFGYDRRRFLKHSGAFHQQEKEQKLAAITMWYHVLEKGLTMPECRLGFGHDAVLRLIGLLKEYASRDIVNTLAFQHALAVLKEYDLFHQEKGYVLQKDLQDALNEMLSQHSYVTGKERQREISREEYYSHLQAPFAEFAASRHSIRHLCGTVSVEQIKKAVALASGAPSACNRQHTRVHCVCDHVLNEQILTLQNGSRGFGHLADKLLLVTASLHDIRWAEERNDLYTNAGIFLMNLCYGLHMNKVAHCILNWSVMPDIDIKLRQLVNLPDDESVVCVIACGDCPDHFSVATSPRKSVEELLTVHT